MRKLKLKYKDKVLDNIAFGTSLYQISKLVQNDFSFPIVGAKLNNICVDLSTVVTENGTVEFLDRSSSLGNKIYGRSLEFLVIAAAKEILDEEADVHIDYSLDNGIYCEVVNQKITEKQLEKLEIKMKQLVKAKLPFIKSKVSRFDAIKYFRTHGQLDKVKNLNYISNSTIDLHKLNNIYDYFFGPLVYDTSQINLFKINYLGQNSFVISYPSVKRPDVVLKYKHHEKLFEKFREYQKWGKEINVDTVSDLNELGSRGLYNNAIRLFEAHYEHQLSKIAEDIYNKRNKIKVVLLSGPSSSGKTTTTKMLALYLHARGLKPYLVSLDNYFVNRDKTPKDENGEYDFASIKAIDISLFNNHLQKYLSGEKVRIPRYDFIKGKKVYDSDYVKISENAIILVEGIHTLNDELTKNVDRENKYKIYITPIIQLKIDNHNRIRTTDLRKLRRIVRDNRTRGYSAEDTLKIWHNVDKEAYENIYPYQDDVNVVINSSLSYEMGVLRIYAEPLLYGIKQTSEVYDEAIRLINLLKQFLPISSEDVPDDSILREFIGGNIFDK